MMNMNPADLTFRTGAIMPKNKKLRCLIIKKRLCGFHFGAFKRKSPQSFSNDKSAFA